MGLERASEERFSGFADLYDASRPMPPAALGPLLASYAKAPAPMVVDIGSGTGLSTRWAATWAKLVIGVEPNAEMRHVAELQPVAGVEYMDGVGSDTGLVSSIADVVTVVQAMHWMDPTPTLDETARILRAGGILAVIDADWPPVSGLASAERAWQVLHRRIRVLESRVAAGEDGDELRRPITKGDLGDVSQQRGLPSGLRSWSKSGHLDRMNQSGLFSYTREFALSGPIDGGADRFCSLMYSQGSYQGLRRLGLTDLEIGTADFERDVKAGFAGASLRAGLSLTWRVRIGVK